MLYSLEDIRGWKLGASDGEIGKVEDLYFDDMSWTVRYLVADTGGWLSGRRVLISPESLGAPSPSREVVPLALTREQVRESPDIAADKPLSRQEEERLRGHYNWPAYWGSTGVSTRRTIGMHYQTDIAGDRPMTNPSIRDAYGAARSPGDPHLRSAREIVGYTIEASDGDAGHSEDFLVDGDDWEIRYVVVRAGKRLAPRRVLLAPEWIATVIWAEQCLRTDLSAAAVAAAPEFDGIETPDEAYQRRIEEHFARAARVTRADDSDSTT